MRIQSDRALCMLWAILFWSLPSFLMFLSCGSDGCYAEAAELGHHPRSPWQSVKITLAAAKPHLIAAAAARCVSISIFYPLDTIKTRMQMGGRLHMRGGGGVRGMYAGLGGSLFGQVPYGMLTFGTYEMYKAALLKRLSGVPPVLVFCAAAVLGDLTGSLWLVPSEVVKVQMQGGMHTSMASATLSILGKSGVGGFYQGYRGQVMRDVPFRAIQMTSYEILKIFLRKWRASANNATLSRSTASPHPTRSTPGSYLAFGFRNRHRPAAEMRHDVESGGTVPQNGSIQKSDSLSGIEAAALGALAGTISAALTTPLDVLRTRLMTTGLEKAGSGLGGLGRDLFAGITPRVVYIGPSCAVFFVVYEEVKKYVAACSHGARPSGGGLSAAKR